MPNHILEQLPSDEEHAKNIAEFEKIFADTLSFLGPEGRQTEKRAFDNLIAFHQNMIAGAVFRNFYDAYEMSGCGQDEIVSRLTYKALNDLSENHSDETEDGVIFLVLSGFDTAFGELMAEWAAEIDDLSSNLDEAESAIAGDLISWYRRD